MTFAKASRMFEPATQGGADDCRSTVLPAGENRSVAIPSCAQNPKYRRWYEELCAKARDQVIPTAYTEIHHIVPRSLGGTDDPSNLVRLSYRQHYVCHWLLTKFHTGRDLQKMQKALWAMTLKASGERLTAGWQIETAKRAVRDMELEDDDAAYLERWRQRKLDQATAHSVATLRVEREYNEKQFINSLWLAFGSKEPFRSEIRALILKRYSSMSNSEFDHQLIAKYFDASPEIIEEARSISILGRKGHLAKKFNLT